jgi:hypothetical protein
MVSVTDPYDSILGFKDTARRNIYSSHYDALYTTSRLHCKVDGLSRWGTFKRVAFKGRNILNAAIK